MGRREEPLVDSRFFDDGEGGISVSRQFASSMRAGRLAAGDVASYVPYNAKSQSAKAVPALMRRVPVALARWMGRYGLDVDAPNDTAVELGDPRFPDDVADPAAPTALERTVHNANYVVLTPPTVGTLVRRSVTCGVGAFEYREYDYRAGKRDARRRRCRLRGRRGRR